MVSKRCGERVSDFSLPFLAPRHTEPSANRPTQNWKSSGGRERQEIGRVSTRAHIILLSNRGYSAPQIADIHDVTGP
jgi:hypothetical protein